MKLWVFSDLHSDRGVGDIAVHAPEFDVFVCAGDVASGDIAMSIEMVAALARGNAPCGRLCCSDVLIELERLRKSGISLSVLTSLPHPAAVHLLQTHKLNLFFDRTDGAGSLGFRKPASRALLAHLDVLGVVPDTAAYVGDTAGDMKMAEGAGVFAIGVDWSLAGPNALKQAGAKAIISRYSDLRKVHTVHATTR